jgi:HEXXH motif-containing protein
MVLNSDDERFTAPLRPDPRPMMGIFHATFVLSRVVRVFRRLAAHDPKRFAASVPYFIDRFTAGHETVVKHARLSDLGHRVASTLEQVACA